MRDPLAEAVHAQSPPSGAVCRLWRESKRLTVVDVAERFHAPPDRVVAMERGAQLCYGLRARIWVQMKLEAEAQRYG